MSQKICLLIVLLAMPSPASAWGGKQDNKPVAELELMNNKELALEVRDVCVGASGGDFKHHSVAMDYIILIGRVLRKRLGYEPESIMTPSRMQFDDCGKMFEMLNAEIFQPKKPATKKN
jgi:hypothetical protein